MMEDTFCYLLVHVPALLAGRSSRMIKSLTQRIMEIKHELIIIVTYRWVRGVQIEADVIQMPDGP